MASIKNIERMPSMNDLFFDTGAMKLFLLGDQRLEKYMALIYRGKT